MAYGKIVGSDIAGAQWGIEGTDAAIYVESIAESFADPYEFLNNGYNQRAGFAYGVNEEQTKTVSGEIKGSGGVLGHTFGAPLDSVIQTAYDNLFMDAAGKFFLTSAAVNTSRSTWATFNATYARWPHVDA